MTKEDRQLDTMIKNFKDDPKGLRIHLRAYIDLLVECRLNILKKGDSND